MDQATAEAASVSGHFRGKLKRRRAILDAARNLIVTAGDAGLTMRAMAALAGVSPATPYNLFGSKQAVLQAIYDEGLEHFYRQFEEKASPEPLTRLFDMIDMSFAYWGRAPEFHKALFGILYRSAGSEPGTAGWSPRLEHVHRLISDAVAAGDLRGDAPVALVTTMLARIFRSVGQEWIDGTLTLARARNDLGRSFGLVLEGIVVPERRDALRLLEQRYLVGEEADA